GCREVRQFDDVGLGQRRETSELGERVADLLLGGQSLREGGEDSPRQRDVARLHLDARLAGVGLDDGQEGGGGQSRRLVRVGVDDGVVGHRISVREGRFYLDTKIPESASRYRGPRGRR